MGSKDFRSDTVTKPTDKMRQSMYEAIVGDDVCGDDPTVIELEKLAADITGKEASLFVPSGTFGNQLCILTHTNMSDEVILSEQAHIIKHEAGALSLIGAVQSITVDTNGSFIRKNDIEHRIRDKEIHFPKTGLICLENALANGTIMPLSEMELIYKMAESYGIPIHLDGARLFNASIGLCVDAVDIAKYTDSVMFCLSKGLCAPIGSMICGNKDFIEEARFNRKKMGGGMRQVGVIAAPGIIALNEMVDRLKEDHDKAIFLGEELNKLEIFDINLDNIQINMVFFTCKKNTHLTNDYLVEYLNRKGFKLYPPEDGYIRLVTNYWIDKSDIDSLINEIEQLVNS
jgi:threonine aldolase